jgi:hypothetical protein
MFQKNQIYKFQYLKFQIPIIRKHEHSKIKNLSELRAFLVFLVVKIKFQYPKIRTSKNPKHQLFLQTQK